MEPEPIQGDKLLLCRLCLANGFNTTFIVPSPENEAVLQKHNILFTKKDLSGVCDTDFLSHICQICWQKITEFNQFYEDVENIQTTYTKQFLKEDGTYVSFEDQSQFYVEVDEIHNEFKNKLYKNLPDEDKKLTLVEPFCTINVDEEVPMKLTEDGDSKTTIATELNGKSASVKVEEQQNDESYMETMTSKDVLNIEFGVSDDENEMGIETDKNFEVSTDDEDGDDEEEEEEEIESSESSDEEVEEKPKGRAKASPKSKKKQRFKKLKRNITVQTTVNVMDEDNERLLRYIQLKCDICSDEQVFQSFSDVQVHYLDTHNQSGYVICCNRKFRRIGRVLQHCTWHDNPEAFKCDSCNKCFQDNVCLRDHITSMHIPVDERRFQCDQCSRLFAKQHLLNTHLKMKHTVKEERPFVCSENECGQRFVLPAYLRLHIEKVHNKADSRVCDVCARFFKCSKSYERHYQVEHTNIDQRVQCDLCQKWFKHLDTLKDHIRRHYAESATCKYCGRVSSNKKSLRLHVRNVHADIDSSVKTRNEFPCSVCAKIFKKKQTLREHMTLHTGEAFLYTCTFCSKTFRSSANMYAHRKRNHPREYEEKCVLAKMQKT